MGGWAKFAGFCRKWRSAIVPLFFGGGALLFSAIVLWTRSTGFSAAPQTYLYLEICGILLSFCFAANALVRFRGSHDRTGLTLAFGFVLSGILETIGYFHLAGVLAAGSHSLLRVPMIWMLSRTLLAVVLLAALVVERRMPTSRRPSREIAAAFLVVAAAAYLTSAAFLAAPVAPFASPENILSRPWDLLPGSLFLLAACLYFRRLRESSTVYDRAVFIAVLLNVASHLAACFSRQFFDAPFFAAEISKTAACGVFLAGALLDQVRLFDQVRALAISDPLTGVANYRRLISAIIAEIESSRRSGQSFSIVLFDMDGLKSVNDQFGHLVGSRALCRLTAVLCANSRSLDTPARYGGDEFALVLPEASYEIALAVAERVREKLAQDGELPRLSVSAGAAVFPADGDTPEKILGAADRALYRMKYRYSNLKSFARITACL